MAYGGIQLLYNAICGQTGTLGPCKMLHVTWAAGGLNQKLGNQNITTAKACSFLFSLNVNIVT